MNIELETLIKEWLNNHGITDYKLDDEYRILVYDVEITVDGNLPEYINFKKARYFTLYGTENTTSLCGCPEIVAQFSCRNCKNLKTLEGCPRIIYRNFVVENNGIENLEVIKEYPFFPQEAYRICLYGNPVTNKHEDLESKIHKICHTNTEILSTISLSTKIIQDLNKIG